MVNNVAKLLESRLSQNASLTVKEIMEIEGVLALCYDIAPSMPIKKAFLLLCGYYHYAPRNYNYKAYLMQQGRIKYRKYSSKLLWNKFVEKYFELPQSLRLFIKDNERDVLKINTSIDYTTRFETYRQSIEEAPHIKGLSPAKEGIYTFLTKDGQHSVIIEKAYANNSDKSQPKESRPPIEISLKDLIESAKKMQKLDPNDHCYKVLINNIFKSAQNQRVEICKNITINEIVNFVGMVGSGKTTFLRVLCYYLERHGYKSVVVLSTNKDVFEMYQYFKKLGLRVSPLIGQSDRDRHIYSVLDKKQLYLDKEISRYLTNICLLCGDEHSQNANIDYGAEPCFKLKKNGSTYSCPYYGICPSTKMQRDVNASNIILTTPAGLAAIKIGSDRSLFLKKVIEQSDIVLFDESDKVQSVLDSFFAPEIDINNYTINKADSWANNIKKSMSNFEQKENRDITNYFELQRNTPTMYNSLKYTLDNILRYKSQDRKLKAGKWKELIRGAFSSLTALELLKESGSDSNLVKLLNDVIIYGLQTDINSSRQEISSLCEKAMFMSDGIERDIFNWLYKNEIQPFFTKEQRVSYPTEDQPIWFELQCVCLIIKLIAFDYFMRKNDELYRLIASDLEDQSDGLSDFYQSRYLAQQAFLPASPIGNIFGIQYTNNGRLIIYRQYAFGRSLMTCLPYLRITQDGKPLGPHVILLSGSSYAVGSLQYHVNCDIHYIIEAPQDDRDYLRKIEFNEPMTEVQVSGGGSNRVENLRKVIFGNSDNIQAELEREGKILLIVNSYDEAESTLPLVKNLLTSLKSDCGCAIMVRADEKETSERIPRSAISSFFNNPSKILIAPASAIERGYNIVDDEGHSAFGSLFFLARPMPVPEDIVSMVGKMNGHIDAYYKNLAVDDLTEYLLSVRKNAGQYWNRMQSQSGTTLSLLTYEQKQDIIATVFVQLLQIYGRLARIGTNKEHCPPRIYFSDGAFRGRGGTSFNFLNELLDYLTKIISDKNGEAVNTLYEPFCSALRKNIIYKNIEEKGDYYDDREEYTLDDIYSEEVYD